MKKENKIMLKDFVKQISLFQNTRGFLYFIISLVQVRICFILFSLSILFQLDPVNSKYQRERKMVQINEVKISSKALQGESTIASN